jgi:hypothetical protein
MKAFTIATLFFAGALAVPFNFNGAVAARDVADLSDVPNRQKGTHGSSAVGKRDGAEQPPQGEVDREGIIGKLIKTIEFQNSQDSDEQAPGDWALKRRVSPPVPANGTATVADPQQAAADVTIGTCRTISLIASEPQTYNATAYATGATIDVLKQFADAAGNKFPALKEAAGQLDEAVNNFNAAAQSVAARAVERDAIVENAGVLVSAREATADLAVPEGSIGTWMIWNDFPHGR